MASTTLPGPGARFLRSRLKALVYLVLAAALVLAAVLEARAQGAVQRTLVDHWRGAYDILVLPQVEDPDKAPLLDAAGRELLDPNFANVTARRISNELLAAVRTVPGVEVAAPVGFIGRLGNTMDWTILSVPLEVFDDEPRQAFRFDVQVVTDDGLGRRLAQSYSDWVLVDARDYRPETTGSAAQAGIELVGSIQVSGAVADGMLKISGRPLPVAASTVFAVDPVVEQELLGEGGAFLEPLVTFDAALDQPDGVTVDEARDALESGEGLRLDPAAQEVVRASPALSGMYGETSRLAPYLRNEDAYPPMTFTMDISRSDLDPAAGAWTVKTVGRGGTTPVGTVTLDVAEHRRPFAGASLDIPWPGHDSSLANYFAPLDRATTIAPLETGTSGRTAPDPRLQARDVSPQGFVRPLPNQTDLEPADGAGLGQRQTYRASEIGGGLVMGTATRPGGAPLEVGTYTPASATVLTGTAAYAPLGAYDPAQVTVLAGEHRGDRLTPALHGLGVAAQPASALTTLQGAASLGVSDPVNAVRVRVADVPDFGPAAVRRIEGVAARISALGLRAHVVAGASAQAVQLFVPDFAFGTMDPHGSQTVADLGWVATDFTTVGAAVSAQRTLAGLTDRLGVLVLVVGGLSLAICLALQLPGRRVSAHVLTNAGLTRRAARRWFLLEDAPGLAGVALAGAAGLVLGPDLGQSLPRLGSVLLGTGVAALLAGLLAVRGGVTRGRPRSSRARTSSRPVRRSVTMPWFVARQVRSHSWLIGLEALGTAVLTTSVATGAVLLLQARQRVTVTSIGQEVAEAAQPVVVGMLLLTAVVGGIMHVLALEHGRRHRLLRARVLAVAGWSARQRARVSGVERTLAQVLALAPTLALGASLVRKRDDGVLFVVVALALQTLLIGVPAIAGRTRRDRQSRNWVS